MCVIELSRMSHDPMGSLPVHVDDKLQHMAQWAIGSADGSHRRQFIDHFFRFQGVAPVDWQKEENRASSDLAPLLSILPTLDQGAPVPSPRRIRAVVRRFLGAVLYRYILYTAGWKSHDKIGRAHV